MPATLELTQDALCSHLTLQVFDCSLDALVTDLDFERFAQYCFGGIRQGAPSIPHCLAFCKPKMLRLAGKFDFFGVTARKRARFHEGHQAIANRAAYPAAFESE